ncbi:MAG: hypothetical protein DSY33_03680 [Archaeoglobus sp.]|jgi:energy-converting hydrogenase B subunit Q|nr:MAG: hypothetical protein DSY33_03680 [Archaeoglobus sp.]
MRAILIIARNEIGVLRDVTTKVAERGGNIVYAQSFLVHRGKHAGKAQIYLEIEGGDFEGMLRDINKIDTVEVAREEDTFEDIFGKRIIVLGGGALVSQVAFGAISEADRHNLRGERISVDTMPVVGEKEIASAVRAVSRLHRVSALVLAGGLMGGKITKEVVELRKQGIPVISLKMFGSVPEEADLVVSDPVMAGTLAVMEVSKMAKFDINRVRGREL